MSFLWFGIKDELKKEFRGQISLLEEKIDKRLKELQNRYTKVSLPAPVYDDSLKEKLRKLEEKLDQQQSELKKAQESRIELEKAVAELKAQLSSQKEENQKLAGNLNTLEKWIALLEGKVSLKEEKPAAEKPIVSTPAVKPIEKIEQQEIPVHEKTVSPSETGEETTIDLFRLKEEKGKVFLQGTGGDMAAALKEKADLTDILDFIQNSEMGEKEKSSYTRIFENANKQIHKLAESIDAEDEGEELSEQITEKLFKIINKKLLPQMVSIYRKVKNGDSLYGEFLGKLNEYLAGLSIYTGDVRPGRKYTGNEDLLPLPVETTDSNLAGCIREIEKLPYYMNYKDEDGEIEHFMSEGNASVYKEQN